MPLVSDPYETMTIKLDKSSIPTSGEGIFAIRDIEENELLAFYNGYHLVGQEEINLHQNNCHNHTWDYNKTKGKKFLSLSFSDVLFINHLIQYWYSHFGEYFMLIFFN